jgi:hypothetical protein
MTYEQGGSSRAGTAVINADGDTLTLWDRLNHHYTTGIATIETTSLHATKVVQEFKKYYDNARSVPSGEFKSYIIRADEGDRIERLKKLLDRNNIDWSYVNASQFTGFNYFSNKNENFKTSGRDIAININQPNSNLIKVLFERSSKLTDSVTYDITAWSVPYVYGLVTYGLNSYTQGVIKTSEATPNVTSPSAPTYAYAVKWNGLHSVKFLTDLLNKGIKVRYAESAFFVKGKAFDKGTLLVTRTGNASNNNKLQEVIREASKNAKIDFTPIESGFVDKGFDIGSGKVHIINAPRVALLAGDNISSLNMGEIWHFFDVEIGYPINLILSEDLNRNVLQKIDVLILPNGNYKFFSEKAMNEALKEWVNTGGKIIAVENTLTEMAKADWGIKLKEKEEKKEEKKETRKEDYSSLKRFENRERDFIPNNNPGSIFKVELDNSHPLAFGYPEFYYTLKQDDNIYEFFKEDDGWNVGVVKKEGFVAGFTGSKIREKLKDGLLFGVRDMGEGSVIFIADNPLFRSFWENGKLLFANAVFLVGE